MEAFGRDRDIEDMLGEARERMSHNNAPRHENTCGAGGNTKRGEPPKTDGDAMLILMLIMLLSSEGGDQALTFALLYIMM